MVYVLQNELADCASVLDLGCGDDSPIKNCKNIKYSIGVEIHKPYIKTSKNRKIHTSYINALVEDVDFKPKSFDAVVMLEVLEHLPEKTGKKLMRKMERWAKKKIIISTPNGFIDQAAYDANPHQKHVSGWTYERMKKMGYRCFGLAGLKILRTHREVDTKDADLTTSIRFKPCLLWFIIAVISQTITFRLPRFAFELLCVKNVVRVR